MKSGDRGVIVGGNHNLLTLGMFPQ